MNERPFTLMFDVSKQFLKESEHSDRWVDAMKDEVAKQRFARGPRGGTYRLVTPPDEWRSTEEMSWHRGVVTFVTRRMGRYVRPSAVRVDGVAVTFDTFTIPVEDGRAMLPNGSTVETSSKAVVVPVPPRFVPLGEPE
jgi:hypothetical protein